MASKYYQICKRQENRRTREKKRADREREREERKKQPHKKPRARMNWTPEENEALLEFSRSMNSIGSRSSRRMSF